MSRRSTTAYIVMAYIVMAYVVMAYIEMACIAMAYTVVAYIVMTCIVMAYTVMAYIVMAYTVMTYTVMAYIVMVYIVMAHVLVAHIYGHTPEHATVHASMPYVYSYGLYGCGRYSYRLHSYGLYSYGAPAPCTLSICHVCAHDCARASAQRYAHHSHHAVAVECWPWPLSDGPNRGFARRFIFFTRCRRSEAFGRWPS